MKDKEIVVNTRPFPILGILGLIFVTLKLMGYITWSWWWVLAPFWAMPAFVLGIIVIAFLGAGMIALFDKSGR